jgi:hypothetical protein
MVTLEDGRVVGIEHCETPDIKNDALAYADCQIMFKLWPRCDEKQDPLDKLECQQKVAAGEDPFAE